MNRIYGRAVAVTPSDAVDLPFVTTGLYVGGTGAVAVQLLSGETVIFPGALAGTILPLTIRRVLNTGTAATNLVALSDT